uniref:Uncharacterized protein LOC114335368 n=1 Tax=Diabrotica virgifera virgifera TaxID=50390 RepID=A0A6P7G305_DIAVI
MGLYKTAYNVVINFNEYFGNLIMLRFALNSVEILVVCDYAMFLLSKSMSIMDMLYSSFPYLVVHFGFVVRCIISCANVENAGKKLGSLCKVLQAKEEDPVNKNKITELAQLIETLPLTFSISGYFTLTRSLVPSLVTGITSYLIIMIQFKVQGECSNNSTKNVSNV